jgi:radical SAM protein with 4Fe4S-binding SPASM domain
VIEAIQSPFEAACSPEELLSRLAAGSERRTPAFLHLLVADRCNHACEHCYQVQGLKGEMTFGQITSLLESFREEGGFVVSISGGEATLRPDLIDILKRANELGLATVLYTNGYLITDELASRLARAHVWSVEVSIYSDVAREHDAVTRVPGSWERTVSGIGRLRTAGINVRLKYTPTRHAAVELASLIAFAERMGAALMVADHVTAREAGRLESIVARQAPDLVAERQPRQVGPAPLTGGPCNVGNHVMVRSDGVLQPCTNVAVEIGRLGDGPLGSALDSEAALFFRGLTWADIHGCRDCDLRPYCSRCYASAATEAGDMLAPYRGACELAVARYRQVASGAEFLAPEPTSTPTRDARLGPYRIESGKLRPVPDIVSEEDEGRARRFAWIRPTQSMLEKAAQGTQPPTERLFQLKRSPRSQMGLSDRRD